MFIKDQDKTINYRTKYNMWVNNGFKISAKVDYMIKIIY